MADLPDEELISAYLDDELPAEERARAERLIAERPEMRQLLEELTALRARLQALPKETLPADFSAAVLRQAEREMLLARDEESAVASPARGSATERFEPPPLLSMRRWRRPLAYSALAAAAALLIMFFAPREAEQRKVAMAPPPARDEQRAAMRLDGELSAAPAAESVAKENVKTDRTSLFGAEGIDVAAPEAAAAGGFAKDAAAKDTAAAGNVAADKTAAGRAAGGAVAADRRASPAPAEAPSAVDAPMAAFDAGAAPIDKEKFAMKEARDWKSAPSDKLLIVYCDVPAGTDGEAALKELLGANHITWEETATAATPAAIELNAQQSAAEENLSRQSSAEASKERFAVSADSEEAVYVEAPAEQMQATLAALASGGAFPRVSIERAAWDVDEAQSTEHAGAKPSNESHWYMDHSLPAEASAAAKKNSESFASPAVTAAPATAEGKTEGVVNKAEQSRGRAVRLPDTALGFGGGKLEVRKGIAPRDEEFGYRSINEQPRLGGRGKGQAIGGVPATSAEGENKPAQGAGAAGGEQLPQAGEELRQNEEAEPATVPRYATATPPNDALGKIASPVEGEPASRMQRGTMSKQLAVPLERAIIILRRAPAEHPAETEKSR